VKVPAANRHVGEATMRLVLLVLADHANADGTAHPSQETIAVEAGLLRRTVRHAPELLAFGGLIAKIADAVPRVRGDTYQLMLGDELGRGPPPEIHRLNSGGPPARVRTTRAGLGRGTPPRTRTSSTYRDN